MNPYEHEQEEIQALKDWWKKNGTSFMGGIAIAIIGVGGWKGWVSYAEQRALAAAEAYQLVQQSANDIEALQVNSRRLVSEYPGSSYAEMAALSLAKAYVADGKYDEAQEQLQWVSKNSQSVEVQSIVALRLAQIKYQIEQYDEAISILGKGLGESFEARRQELMGDAYLAKKESVAAVEAYKNALEATDEKAFRRKRILELKISDAGGRA